jgi:hypothetical protein
MELTDGTVLIAVVAAASPLTMAWVTARLARNRQREDWARQDLVAERAASAAAHLRQTQDRLTEQADNAAKLLRQSDRRAQSDLARVERKVDQVHGLVNSKLTTSMEAQATVLEQLVHLMTEDIDRLGENADPLAIQRRDIALGELTRLREVLNDREVATEAAAAQLKKSSGQ